MTTQKWTPSSRFLATEKNELSVWEKIEDYYGVPFTEVKAPDGHQFKMRDGKPECRFVDNEADVWLCAGGESCSRGGPVHVGLNDKVSFPVLILEPIPEPNPKRYRIELEETGEVRYPKAGEPYFDSDEGLPDIANIDWKMFKKPILRVVSREAV